MLRQGRLGKKGCWRGAEHMRAVSTAGGARVCEPEVSGVQLGCDSPVSGWSHSVKEPGGQSTHLNEWELCSGKKNYGFLDSFPVNGERKR